MIRAAHDVGPRRMIQYSEVVFPIQVDKFCIVLWLWDCLTPVLGAPLNSILFVIIIIIIIIIITTTTFIGMV